MQFAVTRAVYFVIDATKLFADKIWWFGVIDNDQYSDKNERFCRLIDQSQQYYTDIAECIDEDFGAIKQFVQGLSPTSKSVVNTAEHLVVIVLIVSSALGSLAFIRWLYERLSLGRQSKRSQKNAFHSAILAQDLGDSE